MNVQMYVKVDDEVVRNLSEAMHVPQELGAEVLAQAAAHHVTFVERQIPEAVKGKIAVDVNEAGDEFIIRYQVKAGAEASTITKEVTFIPESKFSASSKTPVFTKEGDAGYFFTGLRLTGRPSIEAWAIQEVMKAFPEANENTLEFMTAAMNQAIVQWFESHGIKFNTALGRWQAPAGGVDLPWGISVGGGQIIAGEL